MYSGWYQVAYDRNLRRDLNPARIGEQRLVILGDAGARRTFSGTCPHRGASLAVAGSVEGDAIRCGFHGYRLNLRAGCPGPFELEEYETLNQDGLVFAGIGERLSRALPELLGKISAESTIFPGFEMKVKAACELVIENAFDVTHFVPVHDVSAAVGFSVVSELADQFCVAGVFRVPPSPWQRGVRAGETAEVKVTTRAFGPGIVIAEMTGEHPYWVITAATPEPDETCTIRLSVAIPRGPDGEEPSAQGGQYLLKQSRTGIERDRLIWESLDLSVTPRYTDQDDTVVRFRKFCARFKEYPRG